MLSSVPSAGPAGGGSADGISEFFGWHIAKKFWSDQNLESNTELTYYAMCYLFPEPEISLKYKGGNHRGRHFGSNVSSHYFIIGTCKKNMSPSFPINESVQ